MKEVNRTLEEFIAIRGSKALTYYQCELFSVKNLNKGWFNKYKNNSVDEDTWMKAIESLDNMKRTVFLNKRGGVKTRQHLYLMRNSNGLYKIGISQDVKKRASSLRGSSGLEVEILSVWNTGKRPARIIEKLAHNQYKEYVKIGEWFDIPSDDFVQTFDKFVKSVTSGSKKIV